MYYQKFILHINYYDNIYGNIHVLKILSFKIYNLKKKLLFIFGISSALPQSNFFLHNYMRKNKITQLKQQNNQKKNQDYDAQDQNPVNNNNNNNKKKKIFIIIPKIIICGILLDMSNNFIKGFMQGFKKS